MRRSVACIALLVVQVVVGISRGAIGLLRIAWCAKIINSALDRSFTQKKVESTPCGHRSVQFGISGDEVFGNFYDKVIAVRKEATAARWRGRDGHDNSDNSRRRVSGRRAESALMMML